MHFSRVSKRIYFDSLDRAKLCPDTIPSEDVLAAVWALAGRVKDMAGYQVYPVKKSTPRQSAFNDPSVQTGYGQRHSTCYSYLHSFIHSFIRTHQRGRGDELSTSIHHDRTWWSGQSSELVLYRDMLHEKSKCIKHRHTTPYSTDNDTSLTGTKCTKLRRHSGKVKISLKPNVVAKNAR